MLSTPASSRRRLCRRLTAPLLAAAALAAVLMAPAVASADSSSTLTVVGTSDISDSGLLNVIEQNVAKEFPQYTFKYVSTGTGTAVSDAETGAVGASVLIVHAASLENQFVAGGYSYHNQPGYAIFRNDFVLAGPQADQAGVAGNASDNIAQALADIAAAGINNGGSPKVTFVSRGGTPGTSVEEHALWADVQNAGLAPTGLLLCSISATDGGGEAPIAAGNGVTASGQSCPSGGQVPSGSELPSWYVVTGQSQGNNVQTADNCNGFPSGPNSCYVFTDRGTYDYLASGSDPTAKISSLKIVTRGPQPAGAPGGSNALINYFHAYIINPAQPGETVNLTAAQDFVSLLTSPAFQEQVNKYLEGTDAGGPPFVADASPTISVHGIPHTYRARRRATVTGTVTNNELGYPALAHQPVSIDEVVGTTLLPVASGRTDAAGNYRIRVTLPVTGSYEVVTPQLTQVEDASLTPPFSDTLSPGSSAAVATTVHSAVTALRVKPEPGRALVLGTVSPGTGHAHAWVTVYARRGTRGRFRRVAADRLGAADRNFAAAVSRPAGVWQFEVRYRDRGQVVGATSRKIRTTIPPRSAAAVTLRRAHLRRTALTVTGTSRPGTHGTTVRLLGMRTTGGAAGFAVFGRVKVRNGRFTLHARLRRGARYVLQLESVGGGRAAGYSGLRTVNVR